MSLLRSYKFGHFHGVTELPQEVLGLFTSLVDCPEKQIQYASEIISAGLQQNIRLDGSFNIDAYEAAIRKNETLGKESRRKKELFLDNSDNSDDWNETASSGGIKADVASAHAALQMKDMYEELILEDELQYAIASIKEMRNELLVDAKLDIIKTIQQALKCIPESVEAIKKVCEDYDVVAEQIQVILGSGVEFDVMFG
jgi:hypothetical protein